MTATAAPDRSATTRVLSFHADYGCRDRGACCTAGWPIPIEAPALAAAEHAARSGHLQTPAHATTMFVRRHDAPLDTPALVATSPDGRCVFHHHHGAARCELHRALGHAALPLACRQFPRVSVHDPRGVSITLSHFCPTAAELLDSTLPVGISETSSGFPRHGEYVGLDVRTALPPALRPDMLMDWESWWMWEREAVALLADVAEPGEGLERLSVAVEHARSWRPADGPLNVRIETAFRLAKGSDRPTRFTSDVLASRVDDALAAVPDELRPGARPTPPTASMISPRAHRNFLVAHAFANWTAHIGEGLRSWLRSVEAAHAMLVTGQSIGEADLLLRHLADPAALARAYSQAERYP